MGDDLDVDALLEAPFQDKEKFPREKVRKTHSDRPCV